MDREGGGGTAGRIEVRQARGGLNQGRPKGRSGTRGTKAYGQRGTRIDAKQRMPWGEDKHSSEWASRTVGRRDPKAESVQTRQDHTKHQGDVAYVRKPDRAVRESAGVSQGAPRREQKTGMGHQDGKSVREAEGTEAASGRGPQSAQRPT